MTTTSDVILPSLSMMNFNYNFTALIWFVLFVAQLIWFSVMDLGSSFWKLIYCEHLVTVLRILRPAVSRVNYQWAKNFKLIIILFIREYMQHFPYHIRYRLYAKWKNVSYAKNPLLMVTKAETIHKSRFAIFLTHLKDNYFSFWFYHWHKFWHGPKMSNSPN